MKNILIRIYYLLKYIKNDLINFNSISVDWHPGRNNFGDILNPLLISHLTNKKILNIRSYYYYKEHLLAIGSIIDRATKKSVIWGSGYISEKSKFISKPKKILSVRGPLTRMKLIEQGLDVPEVYGDPALLFPRFYKPKSKKKYSLGILPHWMDKESKYLQNINKDILIIDIQNSNPLKVIDQIYSCENIASSSLHGLIISDAYKIPNVWIKLSNKLIGGTFKFRDYYQSIKCDINEPIIINKMISKKIIQDCSVKKCNLDLDKLIDTFPY